MKHDTRRSLPALAAALAACCLAVSCTAPPQREGVAGPTRSRPSEQAARHIAQLNHGREARYATCLPPACPVLTPKTLGHGDHTFAAPRQGQRPAVMNTIAASADRPAHSAGSALAPARLPEQPVSQPSSITELSVTFASGSTSLTAAARASIDLAVKEPGVVRLAIRGRTDSTGPSAVNQALASARARAVEAYLQRAHPRLTGLARTVEATGACCYVASNETPEGRARNRRVEIDIERTTDDT